MKSGTCTTLLNPTRAKLEIKAVELFCGIGGFAAAFRGQVCLAVDQNRDCLATYEHNYTHPTLPKTVESLKTQQLEAVEADLWWASPPCQPFTIKGTRRHLADPRAKSFLALLKHLKAIRPAYFFMENVMGFRHTQAFQLLEQTLESAGYSSFYALKLCPTQWGIPNRRPRLFIVATQSPSLHFSPPAKALIPLGNYLETQPISTWEVPQTLVQRYAKAMDVIDPQKKHAVTQTFCAGYGKSPVRCGSYLKTSKERIRYFSPKEIKALLGFPRDFQFPSHFSPRDAWKRLGNSLSIPCVTGLLEHFLPQQQTLHD